MKRVIRHPIAQIVWLGLALLAVPWLSCIAARNYTRDELVEDVRYLVDVIEDAHPDPYIRGGGKIAFHLRLYELLHAIPEKGMSRDAFIKLLRPFIAAIGDSHTEIWTSYQVNESQPGGIPFRFGVVEDLLYVLSAVSSSDKEYIGSTLVSVEGIPAEELCERQKRLVPLENDYHVLEEMSSHTLWYAPYLRDLIPEWEDEASLTIELRRPTGEVEELMFDLPVFARRLHHPETRLQVPHPPWYGFSYSFLTPPEEGASLGSGRPFAYLRVDDMTQYGELDEIAGMATSRKPYVTETFRDLAIDMSEEETETLIIDLRENGGGDSTMADILTYFLYGKDVLDKVVGHAPANGGGMIVKLSELYFTSPYNRSLEALNEGREIPWQVGDYDFTLFTGARSVPFEDLPLEEQHTYIDHRYCERTVTFCEEYESGAYEAYYKPRNVIVLVSPWTFSSGFTMARFLYLAGATLIGTPSAQAANSFCNADRWVMPNSGIDGQVNRMYYVEFPIGSDLAHTLPMHHQVTYEELAAYGFDPNAELLLALDWLRDEALDSQQEGK